MNEWFQPPSADVADLPLPATPSFGRTFGLVLGWGMVALVLSWLAVPWIAGLGFLTDTPAAPESMNRALLIDLVLSTLAFAICSYLAARFSRGHRAAAAAGVGLMGWLVYFIEVGGLPGMLTSEYPAWYEFCPDHTVAALIGWLLARRGPSA